jgi:serine/threonine-protein kinase SRPK3
MQDLGSYDVTIIVPKSAANQTPSLPAYVLAPSDLVRYYNRIAGKDLPHVKIFDFGSGELLFANRDHILTALPPAHEVGMHPLNFQCAVEACAPELAFAQVVEEIDNPPVEPPADVWALGAAVGQILRPFIPDADL